MLFGYVLPSTVSLASHSGAAFSLLSPNYSALYDGSPSPKCMFKQNGAVTPATLQLNFTFDGNMQFDWQQAYPYLLLGVVNIGNYANEPGVSAGQVLPTSVKFTVNGEWSGGGAKTVGAAINASGYSNAWALIRRDEKIVSSATSTLQVELTGIFNTGVQAQFGNFGIGEVVICGVDYWPIRQISAPPGGLGPNNRSSRNRGWPIGRSPWRTVRGVITPDSQKAVFTAAPNNARTMRAAVMAAMKKGPCVVAPFWRDPGTLGPNLTLLNQHAMLAGLATPLPDFGGNWEENVFGGSINFEELL